MAQFLRPNSNITLTGITGGFADLDEATPSDADFAYGGDGGGNVLEVGLSNPVGAPQAGTRTLRVRAAEIDGGSLGNGSGAANPVTVEIYEGATQRGSAQITLTGSWVTESRTMTLNGVVDWNNLSVRLSDNNHGGNPNSRRAMGVSWIELEIPDPEPTATNVDPTTGSSSVTGSLPSLSQSKTITLGGSATTTITSGGAPAIDQPVTTNVNPGTASISFTGSQPSIGATKTVTPANQAGLVHGAGAPTLSKPSSLEFVSASQSVAGDVPTISKPQTVSVGGAASVLVAGKTPDVSQSAARDVDVVTGSSVFSSGTPEISQPVTTVVDPAKGSVSLNTTVPSIGQAKTIAPAQAGFAITGRSPTVTKSVTISPSSGSKQFSGAVPSIEQARSLNPAKYGVSLSGGVPDVSNEVSLNPGAAKAQYTGNTPSIVQARTLSLLGGSAVLTGAVPTITQVVPTEVSPGKASVAVSGKTLSLNQSKDVSVEQKAAVVFAGKQVTVFQVAPTIVAPGPGQLTVSGNVVSIGQQKNISPASEASKVFVGNAPQITGSVTLSFGSGNKIISGNQVGVGQARTITPAANDNYITVGYAVGITQPTTLGPALPDSIITFGKAPYISGAPPPPSESKSGGFGTLNLPFDFG